MLRVILVAGVYASAFTAPRGFAPARAARGASRPRASMALDDEATASFDPTGLASAPRAPFALGDAAAAATAAAVASSLLAPEAALAKGGEYGVVEGKVVSLIHPLVMGSVFLCSLGAGYTGLQWRRTRTLGAEISDAKKALKAPQAALAALTAEDGSVSDAARAAALGSEIAAGEATVAALTATRKELAQGDFRDRHWGLGSIILAFGVSFAVEGPLNTYARAGKLFPGPHVYAGCACVALWAFAAALVPQMQKGEDWARSCHIGFNGLATALFAWQITTGWGITEKVLQKGAYWLAPGF